MTNKCRVSNEFCEEHMAVCNEEGKCPVGEVFPPAHDFRDEPVCQRCGCWGPTEESQPCVNTQPFPGMCECCARFPALPDDFICTHCFARMCEQMDE